MASSDNEYKSPDVDTMWEYGYAPPTCEDPDFHGLAIGSTEVCRVHKLVPQKCVAFGGTDTGRRFYMCSLENEQDNCGFVSWLDGPWPETHKNTLRKLWAMYEESNNGLMYEKVESGKMIKKLCDEKNRAEKDYASLMKDVEIFLQDTEIRLQKENHKKFKSGNEEELIEAKKEVEMLRTEIGMLKNVQRTNADVMKAKEKKWDEDLEAMKEEKEALKQEKKRLEYTLHDLFKLNISNKEKLIRIKGICDE